MNVIRYIFIFLVGSVTAQSSLTVQKDLRVQGQTVLGGVTKIEDVTIYADTIHIGNLDGTGSLLVIDGSGKVTRGTAAAGGVSGLNPSEVLFGKSDGTIDQDPEFIYDEATNGLVIEDNLSGVGGVQVLNGADAITVTSTNLSVNDATTGLNLQPNSIAFNNGFDVTISRASGGSSYSLSLPNAQGGANTFLKNDGSGNLSWSAETYAGTVTSIATTSPITGGTITGTGTIGINNADADGSTKGAASFTANDFDATSGNISIDYTNGQSASGSNKGFLTSTDWTTFNNKVSSTRTISTTSPLSGGGDLSANRTLSISDAAADGTTKGAASFTANDFDASSGNISIDYTNAQKASASVSGFVSTSAQDIAGIKTFQSAIELEGATADANEISLTPTDPTADRTATIQDITGTIPMAVGTPVTLTAQAASIAATTLYPVPADGFYQVNWNASVTQAATTSSTLGPFQVRYTNVPNNVVKTWPSGNTNNINQANTNSTASGVIAGSVTVYAKSGTNIQYIMGYTSSGATAMQYELNITVIKIR